MFFPKVYTLIVFSCITSSGIARLNLTLTLTPTDASYCTSQNLTMTCTITDYHGNESNPARDLIFVYDKQPVNPESVYVMTNVTAEYIISNKIPTKNHFFVDCCFKTCEEESSASTVYIKNYVQPELVKNFRCVVQGISYGPVHCSWEYDVDYYKSYNYPHITFIWRNTSLNEWNKAKLQSTSNISFDLGSIDVNYYSAEVGINISSSVCGSSSFTTRFYDVKTVQLPVITGLSGKATKSRCVKLSWNSTKFDFLTKQYMVNCTSNWNIPKTMLFDSTNQTEIELCDLIPATAYSCSVKVKVVPSSSVVYHASIWNKVQSTRIRTLDDVAEKSPHITLGSYTWETQSCDDARTSNYVWIYWKPIAQRYIGGKLNGTLLTYNKGDIPTRVFILHNMSNNARLELDCQRTHKVNIQAVNNIGLSHSPSTLWVYPPQEDIPKLIVEVNNSINGDSNLDTRSMYIEWNRTEYTLVNNYTVFYAVRNGQTCDPNLLSPVEWKTVPGRENNTAVSVSDKSYCYGISVQTNNASSGLKWTDCIYVMNKVPRPPDAVSAAGGQSDNTLTVRWNIIPCSTGQPYISRYETGYCPVDSVRRCKGTPKILSCPGSISSINLDQLDAHTEYRINVRAVTRLDQKGNWSAAVYGTSETGGLTGGIIAVIVLGPLTVIFLILICLAMKKYRKRMKTFNMVDDIPVYPDSSVDQNQHMPVEFEGTFNYLQTDRCSQLQINGRYNEDTDNVLASGSTGEPIESYVETDNIQITDGYVKIHLNSLVSNQNSHENDWPVKENGISEDSENVFDDTGEIKSIETGPYVPQNTHYVLPGSIKQSSDVSELPQGYIQREKSSDVSESPKSIKQTIGESLHPDNKLSQGYIEWRKSGDTSESSESRKQSNRVSEHPDNKLPQGYIQWRTLGDTSESPESIKQSNVVSEHPDNTLTQGYIDWRKSADTSESPESIKQSNCARQHPDNKLAQEFKEWRKSDDISESSESIKQSNRVSQHQDNQFKQGYIEWRKSDNTSDCPVSIKQFNRVSQHPDTLKQSYIEWRTSDDTSDCPELIKRSVDAPQQPDNTLTQGYNEWRNPDDISEHSEDQIPELEDITPINEYKHLDSDPSFDNSLKVSEPLKTTTFIVSEHNNLHKLANDGYITDTAAVCLHSVHIDIK